MLIYSLMLLVLLVQPDDLWSVRLCLSTTHADVNVKLCTRPHPSARATHGLSWEFFFWNTVQRRCPHTNTHQYEFTHVHPISWAPLKIESAYVDIDEVAVDTSLSMSTLSTTEKIINRKCKHPVKAAWVATEEVVEAAWVATEEMIFDGSADFHNSPSLMGRLIFTIVSVLITTRIKHCF